MTALLCAGLSACGAFLPAMLLPPLALKAGVLGVSVASCSTDGKCEQPARQCADPTGKTTLVTEEIDVAVPANEVNVNVFEPAYWQSDFVGQGGTKAERAGEETAGAFVLTDKSVLYVPPPGMEGVRIPLEAVMDVQTQMSSTTGAPRQVTVQSCSGRLDRFTFGQRRQPHKLDSDATAAAAVELKSRIAALPGAAQKESNAAR